MTEVMGGGRFYVVEASSGLLPQLEASIAALQLSSSPQPAPGSFNPSKGDIVFAQFSADDSWTRAMVSERVGGRG